MKEKLNLQKVKKTSLEITPASSVGELLDKKPMSVLLNEYTVESIYAKLRMAIVKCAYALSIEIDEQQQAILCEDIFEVFKHDSIEDIIYCLKQGRQGTYGTTYNKLNMIVIREWMSKHLEEKAIAREKELNKLKSTDHEWKDRGEYQEAVKVGLKVQEQIKELKKDKYHEFKAKYETDKASEKVRNGSLEKAKRPGRN